MNPVFVFLVVCGTVLLWFLLSFTFPWIGRFAYRLYKDVVVAMKKGDLKKESEDELDEER